MNKPLLGALLLATLGLLAWGAKYAFLTPPPAPPQAEGNPMNSLKIIGPYDDTELDQMPSVVPMTDEQRAYTMAIAQLTVQVIQKTSTLAQAEQSLLGKGAYHVPKGPEPIVAKVFRAENFKMKFIGIVFKRADEKSVWGRATLRVDTKGSSKSQYQMNLPASFFEGMVFEKAYAEERKPEGGPPEHVHVFKFHKLQNNVKLRLQFESRPDLSPLSQKYPKSFHYLRVEREGE
jgi:hypothetical protein